MVVNLVVPPTDSAPGLRLRPWRAEDVPALVAAHRDPLLRRWLTKWLHDEAEARRWVEDHDEGWATGTRLGFAVVRDHGGDGADGEDGGSAGRPLGHVAIRRGSGPTEGTGEVGYWTAAEARGQSVAPRALTAVSRWALGPQDVMPLTGLSLIHSLGNQASCRVAAKCGYELRGLLPPDPPAYPTDGHLHILDDRAALAPIAPFTP